jgi:hypothetical protein
MEQSKPDALTTAQLIARLARRGLRVTAPMLGADVHDYYLPPPQIVGRGPRRGTQGEWPAWVLERATRLYELRKRGTRGMMLRLLLFIHDGWGWSYVKPAVLDAFKKGIRSNQIGLRETLHKPEHPGDVEFFAEDAAEAQRRRLAARVPEPQASEMRVNPETMRFIWGLGLFGKPLAGGSLRSLLPAFKATNPGWSNEDAELGRMFAEQLFAGERLTFDKILALASEIDDEAAQAAVPYTKQHIKAWRSYIHRAAKEEGQPGYSTNPFTMCGNWAESRDSDFWEKAPEGITPTQMLAGFIGTMIFGHIVMERSIQGVFLSFMEAMFGSASNT